MRDYLLVLLAVFGIGAFFTPKIPDPIEIDSNVTAESISVATLPELENLSEISLEAIDSTVEIIERPIITTPTKSSTTLASAVSSIPTYQVTRYTNSIVEHPDYSNIYKTGKLIYAHNTKNLFGNLRNLSVGTTINLIENGVTNTYVISDIKTFEKNPNTGKLQLNGSGDYMGTIVKNAFYHNVALMTCTGTSYGNGDASHRLVIFADRV